MNLSAPLPILNSITVQDKIFFTRHLAVMLKSGIPLGEAISSLAQQASNPNFRRILGSLEDSVLNGQSLESSLSKFPNVFDSFYTYLVKVGEESGTLEKNLEYLAIQMKKDSELRKKVFSASLYPAIVIFTAVIVGGGVSLFVLPQLIELFSSLDVVLPASTKLLLFVAGVMKNYGFLILAGFAAAVGIGRAFLLISAVRRAWERMWLSMPAIGPFIQSVQMSQFCRNLGVMLQSGLPISAALETQVKTTQNLIYRGYVRAIQKRVDAGESLSEILDGREFRYFPRIAVRMIEVGEKTGKLDESLLYLGDFFEDEVDGSAKNLTTILEPILLLIVGLLVAFMAMAIISPIYQLTGSIKR